jgi:hypothetical protein
MGILVLIKYPRSKRMNLNNALLIILGVIGLGASLPFSSVLFWASAIVYGFTVKFGNPKSRMVGYAALLAGIFFIATIAWVCTVLPDLLEIPPH